MIEQALSNLLQKTRKNLYRLLRLYGAVWEFECDVRFDRKAETITDPQFEQFMLFFAHARLVIGEIQCETVARGRNGRLYVLII